MKLIPNIYYGNSIYYDDFITLAKSNLLKQTSEYEWDNKEIEQQNIVSYIVDTDSKDRAVGILDDYFPNDISKFIIEYSYQFSDEGIDKRWEWIGSHMKYLELNHEYLKLVWDDEDEIIYLCYKLASCSSEFRKDNLTRKLEIDIKESIDYFFIKHIYSGELPGILATSDPLFDEKE